MATASRTVKKKPLARKAAGKAAPSRPAGVKRPRKAAPAPAPVRSGAVKAAKPEKPKKAKLVRDSFTIPKAEYMVLQDLKQRAGLTGAPAKKSEILRAGIKALAGMNDAAFAAALGAVPTIKTGRPAREKVAGKNRTLPN